MGKLFLSPVENEVLSMVLLILTSVIFILCVLVILKRISWIEMYTTSLFVMFLGSVADVYLEVAFRNGNYVSPKYTLVDGTYYDSKTGQALKENNQMK